MSATLIAIMGPSGTGKSTSILGSPDFGIIGLDPEKTALINVAGKPLPSRGFKKHYKDAKLSEGGNYKVLSNAGDIISFTEAINNTPRFENLIIDDMGYVMGFDVIDNAKRKGYDKWVDGAVNFMAIINKLRACRDNLNIFCFFHTEVGKDEKSKIKTAGAMIDNNIYLDGLFTIILESEIIKEEGNIKYLFRTKSNGTSTCKTPVGMFETDHIPNDLGLVAQKFTDYYYGE